MSGVAGAEWLAVKRQLISMPREFSKTSNKCARPRVCRGVGVVGLFDSEILARCAFLQRRDDGMLGEKMLGCGKRDVTHRVARVYVRGRARRAVYAGAWMRRWIDCLRCWKAALALIAEIDGIHSWGAAEVAVV